MYRKLITAVFAAGLIATPALAASDTADLDISFDRADFATEEGAQAEYARITEEVAERCEEVNGDYAPITRFSVRACEKRTMDAVIASIDDAALTAIHTEAK